MFLANAVVIPAGKGRLIEHIGGDKTRETFMERVDPSEFCTAIGCLVMKYPEYPHVKLSYHPKELVIIAEYYDKNSRIGPRYRAIFDAEMQRFCFHE